MRSERPAAPENGRRGGLVGLEQRLLARGRALACPPGTTAVVGFSGGADSLALAAALGRVAPRLGLVVRLAHVDHGLHDISHQEQEWARGLAAALGLPFAGLRVAGDPRALHPGVGLEEAARRERYRLLASAVAAGARMAWDVAGEEASPPTRPSGPDLDADAAPALLALAHHEADQAETVLLHLLRGAGLAGAAGMAERAEMAVPWWEDAEGAAPARLTVWRPLLAEPRTVVRAYAAGLGLAWVEDPSNEDRSLRRNALRREALPILERISPGATAALARYGRTAADDEAALEALAAAAVERAATPDGGVLAAALTAEPAALRRRAIRRWLRARTGLLGPTADRTDAVLGLIDAGEGGRAIEVGEGWVVGVRRGVLRVARMESDAGGRGTGATDDAGTAPTRREERS